ncbi:MAG: RluA family pseudouridine synthase [Verrucomicrobia bacterium]|nr:RluA family pseudouridine synthase [Verrucomicrobiota bacterium]
MDVPPPARLHVGPECAGMRLDAWIAGTVEELSRARVQALIKSRAIHFADGSPLKASAKTEPGMEIVVELPPVEAVSILAENIALDVLFEDQNLIVINKPAGLVVHPAPGHPSGTLVNALLYHCADLAGVGGELRPGIVHRLDRDTSGVIVVAKCQAAMDSLTRQFHDREVEKEYFAILHGTPHPGVGLIETQIGRSNHDRKMMSTETSRGRDAITNYHLTEVLGAFCTVRVGIETGRTHQIRVHMAHIGHPVVGDAVYGGRYRRRPLPVPVKRQMLHAAKLTLTHPASGERLTFEAPLAPDMLSLLAALRA